ncbi:MAG: YcxB family protein [Clostridiaceae bacterium]|nr:YcxB family protein [Clostridiaceae bacterium]
MKPIEFDVKLKVSELYRFTMRHAYFSLSGIFGLLFSFAAIVLAVVNRDGYEPSTLLLLAFVGVLFPVVQPLILYFKCRAQVRKNENINASLHYILMEEGITVRQDEQEAEVKWYDIRKVVATKKSLYLYMSAMRAFIFPKEQCGGQFDTVCTLVKEQVRKYKDYDAFDYDRENDPEEVKGEKEDA